MRISSLRTVGIAVGLVAAAVFGVSGTAYAAIGGPAAQASPRAVDGTAFDILESISGLCVQPSSAGIGAQLVVAACNPSGDPSPQHWSTIQLGGGKYKLSNQATGGCMDAHGVFASGTPVDTWYCGPLSNQLWADGLSPSGFPAFAQVKLAGTNLCLAVDGQYGVAGVPLALNACSIQDFRQFWFIG